VMLQILDDGRLTDGKGRTVNFKNTVIIMTSNIGSHWISEAGDDSESFVPKVMEALRSTFRPEFLNRVDDVIVFQRLTPELLRGIVELQIRQLGKILNQRDLKLEFSVAAIDQLAKEGFDPVYGARPLKRLMQKKIQDRLAMMLLDGQIRPGDTVAIDCDQRSGELEFSAGTKASREAE
jgi:ATP-dependent Clp protease ATP-binding subunit ClpB